jgi:hypothetical protein
MRVTHIFKYGTSHLNRVKCVWRILCTCCNLALQRWRLAFSFFALVCGDVAYANVSLPANHNTVSLTRKKKVEVEIICMTAISVWISVCFVNGSQTLLLVQLQLYNNSLKFCKTDHSVHLFWWTCDLCCSLGFLKRDVSHILWLYIAATFVIIFLYVLNHI